MGRPVFISYARATSAFQAEALAGRLGDLAYLDKQDIEFGTMFPQQIAEAVLDARVVVVFADPEYFTRWYCLRELRLALYARNGECRHIVVARGPDVDMDLLGPSLSAMAWPSSGDIASLDVVVRKRLRENPHSRRDLLGGDRATQLVQSITQESALPPPLPFGDIPTSASIGGSIGDRFVGRADDLARIHFTLHISRAGAAALTGRIASGGGFGKTRLALEYLHRYGPRYHPGGLFWINADSDEPGLEVQLHAILKRLKPETPTLQALRPLITGGQFDLREELKNALRAHGARSILYVVDNIPEASPSAPQRGIDHYCPGLGDVTVIATSRQETLEQNVHSFTVQPLERSASVLLLKHRLHAPERLTSAEWEELAAWVGDLPLALDLLNCSLHLNVISSENLLKRARTQDASLELDSLAGALRPQVPGAGVRGITEVLDISLKRLNEKARLAGFVLAQLGSDPIPEELMDALPEDLNSPEVRAALAAHHFVTNPSIAVFGSMHRILAEFLRSESGELWERSLEFACTSIDNVVYEDRCDDPTSWPRLNLVRPHALAVFVSAISHPGISVGCTERGCSTGSAAGYLDFAQGNLDSAQRVFERIVAEAGRLLGNDNRVVLTAKRYLGEVFRAQGRHELAIRTFKEVFAASPLFVREPSMSSFATAAALASTLRLNGDLNQALELIDQALPCCEANIGRHTEPFFNLLMERGVVSLLTGKLSQARDDLETASVLAAQVRGEGSMSALTGLEVLAVLYWEQGALDLAQPIEERVLEARERLLGVEHPDTLRALGNLASTLMRRSDFDGSRRLTETALAVSERILGEDHPESIRWRANLATTVFKAGDIERALALGKQSLDQRRKVLGDRHFDTLVSMSNLAECKLKIGDVKGARSLLEESLPGLRETVGEKTRFSFSANQNMARVLQSEGDIPSAIRVMQKVLAGCVEILGATDVQAESAKAFLKELNEGTSVAEQ